MRLRSTLILLVVLLGLGGYMYWVELPKEKEEAQKKTLFQFKTDEVAEVSLVYQDHEIALKKQGDEWHMTKPLDVGADKVSVDNLVNAISECEVKKELTDASSDLSVYGLDKPFATVTVKLKDKQLPAVSIGKNTPVGFSTYISRADDKKILLAGSAFRSGMDKQAKDLRDKTILNFADADVQKFELHGESKGLTLVRKDDAWTLEQPGPYPADAPTVRSFLSTLRSMRAVDFPNDNPTDLSKYGLDKPRLSIDLSLGKDNASKKILIGGDNPEKKAEIYLQASGMPTVYAVSDWVMRDLNKDVTDFRDKTLLAFDKAKISAVDAKFADATQFKLVAGDKQSWHVEGKEGPPNVNTITQWIGDLHDMKGFEIASDNPTGLEAYGLDQPYLSATLTGDDGKAVGTILIGEHKNEQGSKDYFGMAAGGPTVFKVRDYLITRMKKQPQDFILAPTPTPGGATPTVAVGNPAANDAAGMGDEGEADGDGDGDE
ncbi:MAG: DUF4340 domain-containing protein [Deltaproteobacteria bacterium]|nr:DUF4340 domain-containing protein [Deltaproteobacteria bacterium]